MGRGGMTRTAKTSNQSMWHRAGRARLKRQTTATTAARPPAITVFSSSVDQNMLALPLVLIGLIGRQLGDHIPQATDLIRRELLIVEEVQQERNARAIANAIGKSV